MFMLNDKPLALDTPFTHNDISYPNNWLRLASPEERAAIGITEIDDPETWDDRFYWGVGNPKDLEQLKTQWSAQIKDTTNKLLAATDWMVIRKVERDVAIPDETITYRVAVLAECDRLCAAVVACSSVEELVEVLANQQWPEA